YICPRRQAIITGVTFVSKNGEEDTIQFNKQCIVQISPRRL
ncbi:unnamed protein product, partial [marine sediment metagenome]